MRADRSLIPGVGAAVSLVAAVACAFFVTAAIVAFKSWPQVTATSNARALVVAGSSRPGRAIVVSASDRPPGVLTRTTVGQTAAPRTVAPLSAVVVQTARPRRILPVNTPVVQPTAPGTAADRTPKPPSTTPVARLPTALADTTQKTTADVGGVVNGLTDGVARTVAPVSPPLAGTVHDVGASVSGAVVSVGNSLAQLLLGLPAQ